MYLGLKEMAHENSDMGYLAGFATNCPRRLYVSGPC